jgi:hypothetical protein
MASASPSALTVGVGAAGGPGRSRFAPDEVVHPLAGAPARGDQWP